MSTRRNIAFLLALVPASRLVAQEAALVPPPQADPVVAAADVQAGASAEAVPVPPAVPDVVLYANCDGSTVFPYVNALDLICFMNHVAAGTEYANCDGSAVKPTITANDFHCFLNAFHFATQWQVEQGFLDPIW